MQFRSIGKIATASLLAGALSVSATVVTAYAHPPECKPGSPSPQCPPEPAPVPPALQPDEKGCRDIDGGGTFQDYEVTPLGAAVVAFNVNLAAASCTDARYEMVVRAPDATFLAEQVRSGDGVSTVLSFVVPVANAPTCVAVDLMVRQHGVTHDVAPDGRDYGMGTSVDLCSGQPDAGGQTWR